MSCLKRRDDGATPTTLNWSTNTASWVAGSLSGSPKMLPMKQVLSRTAKGPSPGAPIAMQLLTLGPKPVPASSPIATLELPSTLLKSASSPTAVLKEPVVLKNMASSPIALFWSPVLLRSASRPCALLKDPLILLNSAFVPKALLSEASALWTSALAPTAVFSEPVVLRNNAPPPTAVLLSAWLRASAP